jgi:cation diffusion facilitator family transporter
MSTGDHRRRGHDHAPQDDHAHAHPHDHHHDHAHPHDHHPHDHDHAHPHDHDHAHPSGLRGIVHDLFVPHSHDAADSIDDALEASSAGVRALKISLFALLATTVIQLLVVTMTGSVALLADTVHNFADALTAVPLWIAFRLGRRRPSGRYTYGYGRAEDLAGLFIIAVVALSAVVAAWQSIDRFLHPLPLHNLGWVIVAGLVGFAGNEAVAVYRIRVGRRIGSAALVADGVHARIDGFTSLAVVVGAVGVLLGFPLADPIVGLVISLVIIVLLWGTVRSIGRRLLDAIDPTLVDRLAHALGETPGVAGVTEVRLRWAGHRLHGAATIRPEAITLADAERIADAAHANAVAHLPNLDDLLLAITSRSDSAAPEANREESTP